MGNESVVQREKKRDGAQAARPAFGRVRPRFSACILDYTGAGGRPESLEEFGRRLGYAPAAGLVQRSGLSAGVVQRKRYPYQLDRENLLYNRLKEISVNQLDRTLLGILCGAVRNDLGVAIEIRDEAAEQKFEIYIEQIINTCRVYRELLHVKYSPDQYRIRDAGAEEELDAQDGVIEKTDGSEQKTIFGFIRDNINFGASSYFNPDLSRKYEKVIAAYIKRDRYYRAAGGGERPRYLEAEYSLRERGGYAPPEIAPVAADRDYCVYRSMGSAEYERLQAYFPIKRSVEQRILEKGRKYKNTLQIDGRKDAETFVAYTSWHQPGIEKSDIRAMCQRVPELSGAGPLSLPLRSHMGNLQQALSYGGILVKFYIRRDRASLLTKEYLADGGSVAGGSQGNTTNNKIGTKQEGRGGDFSFNLGDNFWASLLFLSTVEKYEGFDLRKQEGAATLPGSLPPAW